MTDPLPNQPAQPLIVTPATDITVQFRPANGHNLVLLQFIDRNQGPVLLLLDAVVARSLIGGLAQACDRADDQPQNLN